MMSLEGKFFFSSFGVPDSDCLIPASTDNAFSVGTESDVVNSPFMSLECKFILSRFGIPGFDGFISTSTDNAGSVGTFAF